MTDEERERLERARQADGPHHELAMMRAIERSYDAKREKKDADR